MKYQLKITTNDNGLSSIALFEVYGGNMICTLINDSFKFNSSENSIIEYKCQTINEKIHPGGFLFVFINNNKIAFDVVYNNIVDIEGRNIELLDIQFIGTDEIVHKYKGINIK